MALLSLSMTSRLRVFASILTCSALVPTAQLVGQCTNPVVPFGPACGVGGPVWTTVAWDPDGAGPLPERLVAGGSFTTAGNVPANHIAAWDPATGAWSPLGSGCNSQVRALAVLPNGDLVAGGIFTVAGGVPANGIARWDGVAWSPLGSGPLAPTYVLAVGVAANGDVLVGGFFTFGGGPAQSGVGRWNGSSWSAVGGALTNHSVLALTELQNGDIVAGGVGGVPFNSLARWDGSTWSSMGGVAGGGTSVYALAVASNGDLIAGGSFASVAGVPANNVARWNGTSWAALGSGTSVPAAPSGVNALRVLPNGDVVAGGMFQAAGGVPPVGVARWNGSTWAALGAGMRGYAYSGYSTVPYSSATEVRTLTSLANGDLVAGGIFAVAGMAATQHIARWDGAQWSALSTGPGIDDIAGLTVLPSGDLVAVGSFAAAGTVVTDVVARWNGSAWSPVGTPGASGGAGHAVVRLPNGDLVVGGHFSSIAGVPAHSAARWNGTSWSAMGMLPDGIVRTLLVTPTGTLLAGGFFNLPGAPGTSVAAWNGTAWNPVGSGLGEVYALTVLPDGRLVAGGWLASGCVAIWNGTTWTEIGQGLASGTTVSALAVMPNGDLVASGDFWPRVARWNGVAWSPLGLLVGTVTALYVLPNGDLLAGGSASIGGSQPTRVARWNGASWSVPGPGLDGFVTTFASTPAGDVWIGGLLRSAGGVVSSGIARLTTTCPAVASSAGVGCSGNVVTATLPWTGSTWRAEASGLPSSALVCVVHGFTAMSLPLAIVFPTALPGCTLHTTPDLTELTVANGGTASAQIALPNTPSVAGFVFHHQMVSLALDPSLAITATNSLSLTVGSF